MRTSLTAELEEANEAMDKARRLIRRWVVIGVVVLSLVCLAIGVLWGIVIANI